MLDEYDFSAGKRGAVDPLPAGKTQIRIALDDDVLDWFRAEVDVAGGGNYQSQINAALREHIQQREPIEEAPAARDARGTTEHQSKPDRFRKRLRGREK